MQLRPVSPADVRPGDFGVTPGTDFFMRLVRFGDRISRPVPHGLFGHAFLVADPVARVAVEGKPSGVGYVDYEKYVQTGAVLFTDDTLTDADRLALLAAAEEMKGTRYDFLDILDAGMWDLVGWLRGAAHAVPLAARRGFAPPFSDVDQVVPGRLPRRLICSVFVAYVYLAAAGRDLTDGHKLHRVTPGDLHRTAVNSAQRWQV